MTDIFTQLKSPFPPDAIKFRIGSKRGQYWSILSYLDARMVSDRLNTLGIRWEMKHSDLQIMPIADRIRVDFKTKEETVIPRLRASVQCDLAIHIDGNLVMRSDVGEEIGDEDDIKLVKTVYSDSFKRAAVHFGIGEYLYGIDMGVISDDDVEYGRISQKASDKLRAKYAGLIGSAGESPAVKAAQKPAKAAPAKDDGLAKEMDNQDEQIVSAIGELATMNGKQRKDALDWAKGTKDKSKALNMALENAAKGGVDREKVAAELGARGLDLFIKTFDAVDVTPGVENVV